MTRNARPQTGRSRIRFTVHALEVISRRGVTRREVRQAVLRPDKTYRDGDCMVHQRGDLAVVLSLDLSRVVTVLKRTKRHDNTRWTDEEMRDR